MKVTYLLNMDRKIDRKLYKIVFFFYQLFVQHRVSVKKKQKRYAFFQYVYGATKRLKIYQFCLH